MPDPEKKELENKEPEKVHANAPSPKADDNPDKGQGGQDKDASAMAEQVKTLQDELAANKKELENIQKVYGEHTKEVGQSRELIQQMSSELETLKEQARLAESAKTPTDAARLEEIYRQIENGDLSTAEGLRAINELKDQEIQAAQQVAAQQATEAAANMFQEELRKRDTRAVEDQFLKDHSDFEEVRASGALDGIKQTSPLHDDFSAYFALQATQAYEKGKLDQAKVAEGVDATQKVLQKPGGSIRQVNKPTKPLTELEQKASGLKALQALRE
jgi:archaellum component FlaC